MTLDAPTALDSGATTGTATDTLTTGSFTPTSGGLLLVAVAAAHSAAVGAVTVAGSHAGTDSWWTAQREEGDTRVCLFGSTGRSGAGTVTVTVAGGAVDRLLCRPLEQTGTVGTPDLGGGVGSQTATGTTLTVSVQPAGDTASTVLGVMAVRDDTDGVSPGSGYTELVDHLLDPGSDALALQAQYDLTPAVTCPWGGLPGATQSVGLVVELVEGYAGGRLHLTTTAADVEVTEGSGTKRAAAFTPGATGAVCNRNSPGAGPIAPVQFTDGASVGVDGTAVSWYSPPLAAVTLDGRVVCAITTRESSSAVNAAPTVRVEHCSPDGTVLGVVVDETVDHGAGEMSGTAGTDGILVAAANVASTALSDGDRLRITLWVDDAADQGGTGDLAGSGNTQLHVDAGLGEVGQACLMFAEALAEYAPPAGASGAAQGAVGLAGRATATKSGTGAGRGGLPLAGQAAGSRAADGGGLGGTGLAGTAGTRKTATAAVRGGLLLYGRAAGAVGVAQPEPTAEGSWWPLLDVLREAAQARADDTARPPAACPYDGEPLRTGPGGVLHCPWDGWTWDGSTNRMGG
jgi:hypothetical protein